MFSFTFSLLHPMDAFKAVSKKEWGLIPKRSHLIADYFEQPHINLQSIRHLTILERLEENGEKLLKDGRQTAISQIDFLRNYTAASLIESYDREKAAEERKSQATNYEGYSSKESECSRSCMNMWKNRFCECIVQKYVDAYRLSHECWDTTTLLITEIIKNHCSRVSSVSLRR